MTTIVPPRHETAARNGATAPAARDIHTTVTASPGGATRPTDTTGTTARAVARYAWFAARIGMGFIFLWAFVDKLFGFGYATPAGKGWIDGGSPTKGFLSGSRGPVRGLLPQHRRHGFRQHRVHARPGRDRRGSAARCRHALAAGAGALMLVMMYTVVLPPTTNPLIDDHLILAVLLIGLAAVGAGNTFGLGRRWAATPLVTRQPWLK